MRHLTTDTRSTIRPAVVAAAIAIIVASTASAHDFWLIPDMFGFEKDVSVHINARSGLRFPMGTPVQPARVAEARIIGATGTTKITEMAIEGTALRLHTKPSTPGQYLVVAELVSRPTRATPAGLIRFLRAEGGAAEAARLEKENAFAGHDSIAYKATSYASTILQLGNGGPRVFSKTAGFGLEFVPVNDPLSLRVGDTLRVKMIGGGKAVAGLGIDATPAADSGAQGAPAEAVSLSADANGVVHLPLTKAGPWMMRSAYAAKKNGGAPNEWDVSRTTYVFNVQSRK